MIERKRAFTHRQDTEDTEGEAVEEEIWHLFGEIERIALLRTSIPLSGLMIPGCTYTELDGQKFSRDELMRREKGAAGDVRRSEIHYEVLSVEDSGEGTVATVKLSFLADLTRGDGTHRFEGSRVEEVELVLSSESLKIASVRVTEGSMTRDGEPVSGFDEVPT